MHVPKSCYTCIHSVGDLDKDYHNFILFCSLKNDKANEVCDKWCREVGTEHIGRGD